MSAISRTDDAKAEVLTITGLLADLAELSVGEARQALRSKARRRRPRRLLDDLAVLCERTDRVIAQARCRVAGSQPDGPTRLVSLHEPDARPISKGRLGKPTEFGYKAKVVDNTDGIILDYSVHIGNPSDTGLLRPAICRVVELLATKPVLVTADRGYWDTKIEADLATAGVTTIVDPAHRETIQGPRRDRTRRHFHRRDQMAHRMRRTDLTPQTRLRLATHRTAQSQRRTHLVCPRRIHPQPHQDQHDQQRPAPTMTLSEPPEPRNSAQTNSSALKNPIHSQRLTIEPING